MTRVGVFASPEEAKEFKQLLLQMRSQGYAINSGQKASQIIPDDEGIIFRNATEEDIPAAGMIELYSFDLDYYEARKPTKEYESPAELHAVNGLSIVKPGQKGIAFTNGTISARYDANVNPYTYRFSPTVDSFILRPNPAGAWTRAGSSYFREPVRLNTDAIAVRKDGYPNVILAKAPTGGIPAASGSADVRTLGSAECKLYQTYGQAVRNSEDWNITLYNFSSTAVAGDAFVLANLSDGGVWVVVAEDCTE